MDIKQKMKKLTQLTQVREALCTIQSKAVDERCSLMFAIDADFGYIGHSKLAPELEIKLKETIRYYYEEEINKVTEEILKLCQEQ